MADPTPEPAAAEQTPVAAGEPRNVIEAIRRVMMELPGIGKMTGEQHRQRSGQTASSDERTIKYGYRSIEQITAEAQRLCGRYGVVFVPEVIVPPDARLAERDFTMGERDTRWTDTYMTVTYAVYGPGGPDDKITAGPVMSLGRDNSDKGYNKAMTQAFKQVLQQVFMIGDPKDEGEHERNVQEGGGQAVRRHQDQAATGDQRPTWEQWGYADEDEYKALADGFVDLIKSIPVERREPIRTWCQKHGWKFPDGKINPMAIRKDDVAEYRKLLIACRDGHGGVAAAASPPTELPEPQEPAQDAPEGAEGTWADEEPAEAPSEPESEPGNPEASGEQDPETDGPDDPAAAAPPKVAKPIANLLGQMPEGVPETVKDGIIAEVQLMDMPQLLEELRRRKMPTGGNKQARGIAVSIARMQDWIAENR